MRASRGLLLMLVLTMVCGPLRAADPLRPFLAGKSLVPPLEQALVTVKAALEREGFQLLGEGTPYKNARVLLVTRQDQLQAAAATPRGGFAALSRVSLLEAGGQVQVAVFNPDWMGASCRLSRSLAPVRLSLVKALGGGTPFGCAKGLSDKDLRDYHYMLGMPYFDDVVELAVYPTQAEALRAVEAGLKAKAGGCVRLARADLPGGAASLFSVGITKGPGADALVLGTVDFGQPRQVAHLPYELLVEKGRVLMLHARFRIANSFPDLSMGTFMKIVKAPGGIEEALRAVANPK